MTGDGVSGDRAQGADIGVAMGVAGTDVAKGAADMILADDNFATIVGAVREGRGIFANIRRFLRFLLSSNVGEGADDALRRRPRRRDRSPPGGRRLAVALLAAQILWINLLTDSAPALALGVDPPPTDVMRRRRWARRPSHRPRHVGRNRLHVGLVMAVVTLAALDLRLEGGLLGGTGDVDEARTMAFTTLVLAQLFNCFNARSERAGAFHRYYEPLPLGRGRCSLALRVLVVRASFLNDAFSTTPLSAGDWLVCIALAASVVLWAVELKKLVMRKGAPRAPSHALERT